MGLGLGILVLLLTIGVVERGGGTARGAHAGEPAPDFDIPAFDGGEIRLSEFRGRPVVLNFWASWCAPCRAEAPALSKVASEKGDEVVFIGVNVRDREEDARKFIAEYGVPYRNGRDVDGLVEPAFGSVGIPTTVFIDANGTIVRTWLGPLDERRLMAFLEELA